MRGVGIVFSRYLELPIEWGVVIGMAIVFFYAVLGGMKGITYTQVAQYCVLIFAYLVPAIFISMQLTGNPIPQLGIGSAVADGVPLLDKLDGLLSELGFAAYTSGTKSTTDLFMITLALMVGTAGLPHVIVRFFTVPKVKDARLSAGYALVFIAILYTTAPAVAAFGIYNTLQSTSNQPIASLPPWVQNWEQTKLIQIEDKNGDGKVQYLADPVANELRIDKDIMVLASPEIANLPNWVVGLVAAGAMAAALSTAAGLLLVISTSISRDLFKTFRPDLSEKKELRIARLAAAGAVLLAGYFGINPPGFVAEVVAFAFGLAASSFFPVILLGIFSTRVNREGATAGMLTGLLFTVSYITYFKFVSPELNSAEHWWWGISPEGIGSLGMALNFLVCFVVSWMTPPPPSEVQQLIQDIRIPKGAGKASDH
jgi:cation/acetate symporter